MKVQHRDHYHEVKFTGEFAGEIAELDGKATPKDGYAYVTRLSDGTLVCCLPELMCAVGRTKEAR